MLYIEWQVRRRVAELEVKVLKRLLMGGGMEGEKEVVQVMVECQEVVERVREVMWLVTQPAEVLSANETMQKVPVLSPPKERHLPALLTYL